MKFQSLYNQAPLFAQNALISIYNYIAYKKRYGGNYAKYLADFKKNRTLSLDDLKRVQDLKFKNILKVAYEKSNYYKNTLTPQSLSTSIDDIKELPILTKNTLKENINDFYTVSLKDGVISKTGGTTGKSLEVLFTKDNMQERFAMLDDFRNRFGYSLGKKTAWLSGKSILNAKDIKKNRFWKTDHLNKVRYYSTFHIKHVNLKYYIEDLIKYSPEFISGFPTAIAEIARYGLKNNIQFPEHTIISIFTTSETLTDTLRSEIETFFKAPAYNQYSASEGAPFIFECEKHNLHFELQSGVFEVVDENFNDVSKGKLLVTSFTSEGTPLIRYDIGDVIEIEEGVCGCGNNNPMVKEVLGRDDDFIYSPENGKIHLTNIANSTKDVIGIVKFQIVQDSLEKLQFNIVVDEFYTQNSKKRLLKNWKERVGENMKLNITYLDDIVLERSGKYRIVKNNIKHLID